MVASYFLEAWKGRSLWKKLVREYEIKLGVYLIALISDDVEQNTYAISYLEEFLKKKYAEGAVILTYDSRYDKEIRSLHLANVHIRHVTTKEMTSIARYYCLQRFSDNVVIVSLDEPFGSYGLLEKDGISMEDMVRNYIFV